MVFALETSSWLNSRLHWVTASLQKTFKRCIISFYMWVFCPHVYALWACCTHTVQERALDLPGMELQTDPPPYGCWEKQWMLLIIEPSFLSQWVQMITAVQLHVCQRVLRILMFTDEKRKIWESRSFASKSQTKVSVFRSFYQDRPRGLLVVD